MKKKIAYFWVCSLLAIVGAANTYPFHQKESTCLILLDGVEAHSDGFDEEYEGLRPGLPPIPEPRVAEKVTINPTNQNYHSIDCDGVNKEDSRYASAKLHCAKADEHLITSSCKLTHGEQDQCLTGCVVHTVQ